MKCPSYSWPFVSSRVTHLHWTRRAKILTRLLNIWTFLSWPHWIKAWHKLHSQVWHFMLVSRNLQQGIYLYLSKKCASLVQNRSCSWVGTWHRHTLGTFCTFCLEKCSYYGSRGFYTKCIQRAKRMSQNYAHGYLSKGGFRLYQFDWTLLLEI